MKKTLKDRIKEVDSSLNVIFPAFSMPISYFYMGATLLSKSRYLNWVYKRKILDIQGGWSCDLVIMAEFANEYIESENEVEEEEGYRLMCHLIIEPFYELNRKRGEKKYDKSNENTKDCERNM